MNSRNHKGQRLANAFKLVAIASHAMVGVVGSYSDEEYRTARSSLVKELAGFAEGTELHRRVALAITLLDAAASQPAEGDVDQRIWRKRDLSI